MSFLRWTFTLKAEITVLSQNVRCQSLSAMIHTLHWNKDLLLSDLCFYFRNQRVTCASESIPRVDLTAWVGERIPWRRSLCEATRILCELHPFVTRESVCLYQLADIVGIAGRYKLNMTLLPEHEGHMWPVPHILPRASFFNHLNTECSVY